MTMKVLIAPNSFKHCLDAYRVGRAIAAGIGAARPDAEITIMPLSDGGDGFLDVCARCLGGEYFEEDTLDPLARPIKAPWLKINGMAVIELAQSSGLARMRGPEEYNPMKASTCGTGILMLRALNRGCRTIVIGLGGSATVDAGCGMATALGFKLLDKNGCSLPPGGGNLGSLKKIDLHLRDRRLSEVDFVCLTDVRSPLLGPNGAARLFGPQKGAGHSQVELLENNLAHWAAVVKQDLGIDVNNIEGAGAAGGAGAGCAAFFGATPRAGAEWIGRQTGLEKAVAEADIILTGEGRIDAQTAFGKTPEYVGRLAKKAGKHVIALGGTVAAGTNLESCGITACRAVTPPGATLSAAFRDAEKNLALEAERVIIELKTGMA